MPDATLGVMVALSKEEAEWVIAALNGDIQMREDNPDLANGIPPEKRALKKVADALHRPSHILAGQEDK